MASKSTTRIALFLALNLLFFSLVSATPSPGWPVPCPIDALEFGVCANLLGGSADVTNCNPPKEPCCSLIADFADIGAAICFCTAIKANVLGNNLNVPLALSVLLNACGKNVPSGWQCA